MARLFGHAVRWEMLLLYVAEALICFTAIYIATPAVHAPAPNHGAIIGFAASLALSAGPVSGAVGLYRPDAWSAIGRLIAGSLIASLLLLLLTFSMMTVLQPFVPEDLTWHRLTEVLLAPAAAVLVTHVGFASAQHAGLFTRRIAVIRGPAGAAPLERLIHDGGPRGPSEVMLTVSADAADERLTAERLRAQRIWAVVAEDVALVPTTLRRRCEAGGIRVFSAAEFCEYDLGCIDPDRLPTGRLSMRREGMAASVARRGFDIIVSLALLALTWPALLLTALAIKLDSPGPVFYRQERVGRDGRGFMLLKFRSMSADAEAGGIPRWASKQDSRVTRVGSFIRLIRLDEVPQVLNVLRGDMAFIGPRPERPAFVEQLGQAIPHYHERACVKPGITGWAQVNFPYGASVEDTRRKLAYDLYYVRRRSLFLDLLILVATVRVVLFQEGSR